MADTDNEKNKNPKGLVSPLSSAFANPIMDKMKIESELYKKSMEFDAVNELLSLTRKLYQITLLTLEPSALAEKIATSMRDSLKLEMTAIFLLEREKDTLSPLTFVKSERLISVLRKADFLMRDVSISGISKRTAFNKIFDGEPLVTTNLVDVWGGLIDDKILSDMTNLANVKTTVIYPLLTEEHVLGVVVLGYTLPYEKIPEVEKETIKSFASVIAVALDKARTYRELDTANASLKEMYGQMVEANKKLKTIDETKSTILSFASHHLQNPMENVVMGTSMIADGSFGAISPEVKNAAVKTFESARHLSLTIKLWLKALEFEENRVTYKMAKFDLADLVNRIATDWTLVATTRKLDFSVETDNKPPYTILADENWMRDVIMNLTDNAFKMTEKGFVKIKIEKIGIEKIRLSVSDSGVGVDAETLPKLFEKFERGDEGYKKDIEGTGLGLYISKKIIEDGHKGRIWAESAGHEKGATFSIELDLA